MTLYGRIYVKSYVHTRPAGQGQILGEPGRNLKPSGARSVPQIVGSGQLMGHHSIWSLRAFWGPAGGVTKIVRFILCAMT